MGCRCSDMKKCTSDISTIRSIKRVFIEIKCINDNVTEDLHQLASTCDTTFYCDNAEELDMKIKKLNEDIKEGLPHFIEKCEKKIKDLKREYRSMSSEDNRYHEEQRRKSSHSKD